MAQLLHGISKSPLWPQNGEGLEGGAHMPHLQCKWMYTTGSGYEHNYGNTKEC